jgi:hypothetical protein
MTADRDAVAKRLADQERRAAAVEEALQRALEDMGALEAAIAEDKRRMEELLADGQDHTAALAHREAELREAQARQGRPPPPQQRRFFPGPENTVSLPGLSISMNVKTPPKK